MFKAADEDEALSMTARIESDRTASLTGMVDRWVPPFEGEGGQRLGFVRPKLEPHEVLIVLVHSVLVRVDRHPWCGRLGADQPKKTASLK